MNEPIVEPPGTTLPAQSGHLKGLIAAPFTAMHPDGSLHLECVAGQAAHLKGDGVSGAFICGTTGEGLSLTMEERKALAEAWAPFAGELKVIVHTGHLCLHDAMALARHANELPVHATAAMAPCFFRPASLGALVRYCEALAGAAPDHPFYYYHIPSMTGVNFPIADFLREAQGRIPNLAGVKFTDENLMDFAAARAAANGRYDLLFGRDEILLGSLALGAEGAVGSTYNYAGPIYLELIRAFREGDLARAQAMQALANRVIAVMIRFGGMTANKAIMSLVGPDCGPVRAPLEPLGAEATAALRRELQETGFFAAVRELRGKLDLAVPHRHGSPSFL